MQPGTDTASPPSSPWFPLEQTIGPYLKHKYNAKSVREIDPTADLLAVSSQQTTLRIRWQTELSTSIADLELIERADGQARRPAGAPPLDPADPSAIGACIIKAVESDPTFAEALNDIERNGYSVSRAHVMHAGLATASSSLPAVIGIGLGLNADPAAPAGLEASGDSAGQSTYWQDLAGGYICELHPNQAGPEHMKRQPTVYPLATHPLSEAPVPGANPRVSLTLNDNLTPSDQEYVIMETDEQTRQQFRAIGTLPAGQISAGCVVLPPHPDPNYSGPPVPLGQRFVLMPEEHILSYAALAHRDTSVHCVRLSEGGAGGEGKGEDSNSKPRSLMVVTQDVASRVASDMLHGPLATLRAREVDLRNLSLRIGSRRSSKFATCEVSKEEWYQPGTVRVQLELLVMVYHNAVQTDARVAPLIVK